MQLEETPTPSQDTPTVPTERVQSAPQGILVNHYPTRNRHAPRYLADFVTK